MPSPPAKVPVTVLAASRASPPGIEPMPVARRVGKSSVSLTPDRLRAPGRRRPRQGGVRRRAVPAGSGQPPGRMLTSLMTASAGRSSAVSRVVATDSGLIQRSGSYSLPSCWWIFCCMALAVRPG